ncbi:glycosyltransferase [Micromonospora mirobrigensis]|uniref:glycosyltransferase n=1 Tax=Micromonospora mirobrigensis TaxID=262898 RepID=UPI00114CCC03|nr:glycosyltransferase [Micromonospora mirobrigensis]
MTHESRYIRTPDGRVWTQHQPDYPIWRRYLTVFASVRVVARVLDRPEAPVGSLRVDGDGVSVWPVPYYVGPWQYLRERALVARVVADSADPDDAVILSAPSILASHLAGARRRQGLPYGVQVVGDPYDVFAPGVVRHPARPLLRRLYRARLRGECGGAVGVSYVTRSYLQARYPAADATRMTAVSDIELPEAAFVPHPRRYDEPSPAQVTLVSVGSLEQLYKGIDTLVEALPRLAVDHPGIRLVHAGTGRMRDRLVRLAADLGVADRVSFPGWVRPGPPLQALLDRADLFVMPSRTEGLPRALVEAMARALPAVGARVGGIPELLPADDLVPPDDPGALATAIHRMLADRVRMADASARNLARAGEYSRTVLAGRREHFYRDVREATARHAATGVRQLSAPRS